MLSRAKNGDGPLLREEMGQAGGFLTGECHTYIHKSFIKRDDITHQFYNEEMDKMKSKQDT